MTASVQAESGAFSSARCFTSLDGAWFLPNAGGTTALARQNGWTGAPFGTAAPAVIGVRPK